MSITRARTFIEKTGCGFIVGIVLIVVLVVGLIAWYGSGEGQGRDGMSKTAIATVGEHEVSLEEIERLFSESSQSAALSEDGLSPLDTARTYGSIVTALVSRALVAYIADKRGVELTDAQIVEAALKEVDTQLLVARQQLVAGGKLKADATEQEFQQALRAEFGDDAAGIRKRVEAQTLEDLKDETKRAALMAQRIGPVLRAAIERQITLSDEDLKKGFETWITKRVAVDAFKRQGEDVRARAEKILKEIEGGLSFEAAMEKYSDDPKPQGKRKSDATVNLTYANLTFDPAYEPLLKLKPGQTSKVIMTSTGPCIFKVQSIKMMLPADFEQRKNDYRQTRLQELSYKELQDELRSLRNSDKIAWKSEGFKALYDWVLAETETENVADKAKMRTAMLEVAEKASAAVSEGADPAGSRPAVLAAYAAFEKVWETSTPAQKSELAEQRLEHVRNVLEITEYMPLRLEMVRMLLEQKQGAAAVENLLTAASNNQSPSAIGEGHYKAMLALRDKLVAAKAITPEQLEQLNGEFTRWKRDAADALVAQAESNQDYSESGQRLYNDINGRVEALKRLGAMTPEIEAKIAAFQKTWRAEKIKFDKEMEEQKKRDEEERKKAEAEAKKANAPTAGGAPKKP